MAKSIDSTRAVSSTHEPAADTGMLEAQLRESLKRYEMLFMATHDVLYELDLSQGTIIWNEALYTQYGYSPNEPTDNLEWWTSHIHPDDALKLENEFFDWFSGKDQTWQAEYRFRKADGTYAYIRDRGVVQRGDDGNPVRIIGSFLDITHQKQLEHAKDEFISLVSHQLRTPLTVMRIKSEMLLDGMYGSLAETQTLPVHDITESSIRLIKLVGDILDVSRAEMGSSVAEPREIDANRRIAKVVADLQPLAQSRQVSVMVRPDNLRRMHTIDPAHFDHILNNLLSNAIRYSNHGGTVVARLRSVPGGCQLSVVDHGIGIPKKDQARIAERFFRADNSINAKEVGTGLGLYMVRLLARASDGKMWFASTPGKGSTFYVYLPEIRIIN